MNRTMAISLLDLATNTVVYPRGRDHPAAAGFGFTNAGSALYFDAMTDHRAPARRDVHAERVVVYFSIIFEQRVTRDAELAALRTWATRTNQPIQKKSSLGAQTRSCLKAALARPYGVSESCAVSFLPARVPGNAMPRCLKSATSPPLAARPADASAYSGSV
jgi:hypothetical protein